jgi:hypothetical protein
MSFTAFMHSLRWRWRTAGRVTNAGSHKKRTSFRWVLVPRLEALEDRTLLSGVSFSPPVSYPVVNPQSVAVGDFNGDGKQDLVVTDAATNGVSVLLGNGDGSFQAAQGFAAGYSPDFVAVADVNGDGKPDLVVADAGGYGHSGGVSVLLGNGDGTFQAPRTFGAGLHPISVAVADFNGDGKPDLAVANLGGGVSVLLGNGDGTFQAAQNFAAGSAPESVAVGDFNGDGKSDLVVANNSSSNVSVLLGNGDGTFQAAQSFTTGSGPFSVAVGDFNGDGKLDLAVTNVGAGVSVLLGNGDGTFQTPPELRDWTWR